ncbi:MAG: hypothetical protein HYY18_02985 [Planctomycetes bacterium]|nr:hypothetical protein [Planctomycetota bacterium]
MTGENVRRRAAVAACLLLPWLGSGCRTCHGVPEDWTVSSAMDEIRNYESVSECTELSFTFNEPRFVKGVGAALAPCTIPYKDIAVVRLWPRPVPFDTFPFLPPLLGPMVYDLILEMDDGSEHKLVKRCYPGFSIFPLWLYPYIPVHGYPLGHAIDYMRQHAEARAGEREEKGK